MQYPKISIITPSYNQGQFLEETIQSVVGQMYPDLEYIIMDGGSTDNSVEIIKKYEKHITYWESKSDDGQAHAINKGFEKATGDILAWINSDDYYLPGTLKIITSFLGNAKEKAVVFGNAVHMYQGTKRIFGSDVSKSFREIDFRICDTIIQPSSFWNRSVLEEVGFLNEKMHYAFDWEWFIRAQTANVQFTPIDNYLSVYRITGENKTVTGGDKRKKEIANIYEKYSSEKVCKANKYISQNKKAVNRFISSTKRVRPHQLRELLFKLCFPRVANFDYKYIQIFVNNNR